ncbi:aspartate aminotransferase family protein [Alkaliphilus serpentinus]|uniref:Aminotransferase class III-fold pyridoxal phosphate-dependent enzyme n=1 Tax=Alkaliphilus serpentinus TaxID=1482731 RepID=A0A833HN53_9FIRM|nr:acetylornithine transaminase [Alkaliphilus serpentinus]KAB3529066.1 aminotransferase class III-fold pyridoxal phosphate-dependent enzyme [Alkaliphilus serpentinus]
MKRDWMELDKEYLLPTYGRMPVVVKQAEGMYITDEEDNRYLDMFSGLAVNILGHCHPLLVEEIKGQAQLFSHISNFFYNKPAILLAEKLVHYTFPGKIFFTNSGAESTEAAIKYIHKYGKAHDRKGMMVFKNSFHGRTSGALKLTRMASVQQDFDTIEAPVYQLDGQDIDQLKDFIQKHKPAAFIFEPISGSGGIQVITKDFMEAAERLCKENQVLFCVDEIQTGMGRTGKLFAYQHTDVKPDILLFAKGIGGGLPLGGILVAEEFSHYFKSGDHGTTFAPNPISSALGLKTLEILEGGLLEHVVEMEAYLMEGLRKVRESFPTLIGDIRGLGMMMGMDILGDVTTLKDDFMKKNILINITNGNILRLLPPLIIEKGDIDIFIKALTEILTEWKD